MAIASKQPMKVFSITCWLCLLFFSTHLEKPVHAQTAQAPESAIRVRTAPAEQSALQGNVSATGSVTAFRRTTVAAELTGRVVTRHLEPGAEVDTADLVVSIDPERAQLALAGAEANAQSLKVQWQHARHELRRGEDLYKKRVISEDTLDDLRFAERTAAANARAADVNVATAARALNDASVRVPFAGQIDAVHVQVGDYVNPGQPIFTLTDFSISRVHAGVSEAEALLLKAGQASSVQFDSLGGTPLNGTIKHVSRIKDPATGTFPVEIWLDPVDIPLREGMVGRVTWQQVGNGNQRLNVPSAALLRRAGQISVYVIKGNRARLQAINIGRTNGQRVEVISGLKPGDQVAIDGIFALHDGALIEHVE